MVKINTHRFTVASVLISALAIYFVAIRTTTLGVESSSLLDSGFRLKERKEKKEKRSRPGKSSKRNSRPFRKGDREKEFRERLGDTYRVYHTDHFFIMYNVEEDILNDSILRLEKTYDAVHQFVRELDFKINYPREKLPIVLCHDFREYHRRCKELVGQSPPPQAAGLYYRMPHNFCIFYDVSQSRYVRERSGRVKRLKEEARGTKNPKQRKTKMSEARKLQREIDRYQEMMNRSVVQHEVAHELLFNFGVHNLERASEGRMNPLWFTEGLATHFEPAQTGAGVNRPNRNRLRAMCDALQRGGIPNLREFVGNPTDGKALLPIEGYGWSWLLTHYLIRRKDKELPVYVELIKKREKGDRITAERDVDDFEKCFGKIDDAFEKKWQTFAKGYLRRACGDRR